MSPRCRRPHLPVTNFIRGYLPRKTSQSCKHWPNHCHPMSSGRCPSGTEVAAGLAAMRLHVFAPWVWLEEGGLGWVGSRLAPKVVTHGQCARTSLARLGTPLWLSSLTAVQTADDPPYLVKALTRGSLPKHTSTKSQGRHTRLGSTPASGARLAPGTAAHRTGRHDSRPRRQLVADRILAQGIHAEGITGQRCPAGIGATDHRAVRHSSRPRRQPIADTILGQGAEMQGKQVWG